MFITADFFEEDIGARAGIPRSGYEKPPFRGKGGLLRKDEKSRRARLRESVPFGETRPGSAREQEWPSACQGVSTQPPPRAMQQPERWTKGGWCARWTTALRRRTVNARRPIRPDKRRNRFRHAERASSVALRRLSTAMARVSAMSVVRCWMTKALRMSRKAPLYGQGIRRPALQRMRGLELTFALLEMRPKVRSGTEMLPPKAHISEAPVNN